MIRRLLPLLIVSMLLTALATQVSLAQDGDQDGPVVNGRALEKSRLPRPMIDGVVEPSMVRESTSGILSILADDPSDTCEDATDIALVPEIHPADGISYDVLNATSVNSDPVLTCMWGTPQRTKGFRTVWYKLLVPASGRITLDTFGSAYDTVLGVYKGECGALQQVACNDDNNGFTSGQTLAVTAGEEFYIVFADREPGIPNIPNSTNLQFSAFLEPIQARWDTVDTQQTTPAISRHATAAYQGKLYVIGGQTGGAGVPFVSNQVLRLNPGNGNWKVMAQIPGAGYSNTTAALVGDHIYVPSGYNGNDLGYDGLHWSYRIPPNDDAQDLGTWSTVRALPEKVAWAASAVPPSTDNPGYYLIGGTASTNLFGENTTASNRAYFYSVNSDKWLPITSMQTARYAHTGAWVGTGNRGACVAGGLGVQNGGFVLHTSAECYWPGTGWRYIGDMNIARIGAGSAVGPDGKWYVFGGLTVIADVLVPVLQTEVYDPRLGTWTLMSPEFNLGGQDILSARGYPRGSFIGNDLYVVGGSIFVDGEHALPLTEKLTIPPVSQFMPISLAMGQDYLLPDDTIGMARPLPFGFHYRGNFNKQRDFYDFFSFSISEPQDITIQLQVPDGNNFDLYLYGHNKTEWGSSTNPLNGADELIEMRQLGARQYFVLVERKFPTGSPDKGANYDLVILN
ncbi:MAG: pre-peptidase C-terminal domain-containing protein [Candidatus Promineifilaceae bacterium]